MNPLDKILDAINKNDATEFRRQLIELGRSPSQIAPGHNCPFRLGRGLIFIIHPLLSGVPRDDRLVTIQKINDMLGVSQNAEVQKGYSDDPIATPLRITQAVLLSHFDLAPDYLAWALTAFPGFSLSEHLAVSHCDWGKDDFLSSIIAAHSDCLEKTYKELFDQAVLVKNINLVSVLLKTPYAAPEWAWEALSAMMSDMQSNLYDRFVQELEPHGVNLDALLDKALSLTIQAHGPHPKPEKYRWFEKLSQTDARWDWFVNLLFLIDSAPQELTHEDYTERTTPLGVMRDFVNVFAPLYTAMLPQQRSWSPRHDHLIEMLFKVVLCLAPHHEVDPDFMSLLEKDILLQRLSGEMITASGKKPSLI